MPKNLKAVKFWLKVIGDKYRETFNKASNDDEYDMRVFSFDTIESVLIREATQNDYPAMVDIGIDSWRQSYKDVFPTELLANLRQHERLKGRKKFMSEPKRYSYVALINGEIVGYVDFGISRRPQLGVGEIYSIYTQPSLKRAGIGGKLIEAAIIKLEDEKLLPCIVTTLKINSPARKFYEKHGFILTDDIIMTKVGDLEYPEVVFNREDIK